MDVHIRATQVAQRLLDSPRIGFKHTPGVLRGMLHGSHDGRTKLERHIESRCTGPAQIQLYSREIVERVAAASYQVYNPVQPALAARYFKSRSWRQTKRANPGNVAQIELAELIVVGKVQKNSLRIKPMMRGRSTLIAFVLRAHRSPAPFSPPKHPSPAVRP